MIKRSIKLLASLMVIAAVSISWKKENIHLELLVSETSVSMAAELSPAHGKASRTV